MATAIRVAVLDDLEECELMQLLLPDAVGSNDFCFEFFPSGEDPGEILQRHFDAVVLGHRFHGVLNALDLVAAARAAGLQVDFIVYTGFQAPRFLAAAREQGVAVVFKGHAYALESLLATIRSVVADKKNRLSNTMSK